MSDAASAVPLKRSVRLAGHPTSISLEAAFWVHLRAIAEVEGLSLNALVTRIDRERGGGLSSAARIFVLDWIVANGAPPAPSGHPSFSARPGGDAPSRGPAARG